MQLSLETIAGRIRHAKSVAIFTHMRPDGDALGSALAIGRALDFLQVQNEVCVETELPSNLAFLQGIDKVKKEPSKPYDMLVCVDCSDVQRLGALSDEFLSATRKNIETVNIDHHVSNTRFAKMNFVRTCSANCMNVFALITYMGTPLDKITAEYLLTGLLTDSGNFSHDDVTEETLSLSNASPDSTVQPDKSLDSKPPLERLTVTGSPTVGVSALQPAITEPTPRPKTITFNKPKILNDFFMLITR